MPPFVESFISIVNCHIYCDASLCLSLPQNPIEVTLSPPPDLIVSALIVGEEYSTGSQLLINYTVTNNGAGAPFETFWTDKTVSL